MLEKLIYWVENRPRFKEKVDLSKMKTIAASMKNPVELRGRKKAIETIRRAIAEMIG